MRTLVWFRGKDLRVSDHAPLCNAVRKGEAICVFVLDPFFFAAERARELPHRMQYLLESIDALAKNVEHLGSRLLLVGGKSVERVPEIARAWRVDRVVAHRWSEPFARLRDERIANALEVPFELWDGETLAPPGSVLTAAGGHFSVFTPFARAHRREIEVGSVIRAPRELPNVPKDVRVEIAKLPTLSSLGIERNPNVVVGGERAARERFSRFLKGAGAYYDKQRDRLDLAGTSRLSADLKFGTLSIRTVWTSARRTLEAQHREAWESFSNELLWREFTHELLWNRPTLLEHPCRAEWENFPWR